MHCQYHQAQEIHRSTEDTERQVVHVVEVDHVFEADVPNIVVKMFVHIVCYDVEIVAHTNTQETERDARGERAEGDYVPDVHSNRDRRTCAETQCAPGARMTASPTY